MKWIKTAYLQNRKGINCQCNELFIDYELITNDKTSPNKLARYLTDLNVEVKKITGSSKRKYFISYENLLKSYYDKNWLDSTTDYEIIEEYENMKNLKEDKKAIPNQEIDEEEELRKLAEELDRLK
jgi:hypothetical protein